MPHTLSRRGFALGAIATVATGTARAADLSGVTLRIGDQVGYNQAKLKVAGLLDDVPYKIEWSVYPAAVNLHEALKAGAIDVGGSNDSPMVSAFAGGSTAVAVSAWSNGGRGTSLLVPKTSTARSVADLRGKTICPTTRGSVAHFLVIGVLQQAGIPLNGVTLAFLNPVDAGAAFAAGSIDAWATWSLYEARARGQLGARVLHDGKGINSGYNVQAALPQAVADPGKLAAIADFSSRIERSNDWSRANPAAHKAWFKSYSRQDDDIAAELYEDEIAYRRLPIDDAFAARLRKTYETWLSVGVLKPGLDLDAHVYRSLSSG
jgi:sulfonate transport system substrate-binding protein